jgi:hypothetical protein
MPDWWEKDKVVASDNWWEADAPVLATDDPPVDSEKRVTEVLDLADALEMPIDYVERNYDAFRRNKSVRHAPFKPIRPRGRQ